MKNLQIQIDERVACFVGDLQRLVRSVAVGAVEQAFPERRRGKGREGAGKGKRPSSEISILVERLYEEICAHPGESMGVLSGLLEQRTLALSVPVGRLLKQGRVKKTGSRQQTRYYPVARQGSRKPSGGRPPRKTRR